jgi:Clp amino terminal domain, pathogenicity island component
MTSFPSLDELVDQVRVAAPDADPLEQLTESMILSGKIADLGDELVGYFVEQAREAGATWAEIGVCMGVSKQAVQKRFVSRGPRREGRRGFFMTRMTDEARHVVRRAGTHARAAGSARIGTEHLVLGIIDDPESRASVTLESLGASLDDIRASVEADEEVRGTRPRNGRLPFSTGSKKVLELALREAIRSGDRAIGSEHILLGILRDERTPGGRILAGHGITRKDVAALLA